MHLETTQFSFLVTWTAENLCILTHQKKKYDVRSLLLLERRISVFWRQKSMDTTKRWLDAISDAIWGLFLPGMLHAACLQQDVISIFCSVIGIARIPYAAGLEQFSITLRATDVWFAKILK